MANTKAEPKPEAKTTRGTQPKNGDRTKPTAESRQRRAKSVAARTATKQTKSAKDTQQDQKGLVDLLEHGLKDMYYAERKIFRSLPKMIKAAEDAALVDALTAHREETQGHIETLEAVFESMGLRPKAEKCDAIDGILTEADSILEDFGGSMAGDAAIIFCARAVEFYEIARYTSMIGFADALGLDEVHQKLQSTLDQETSAESKLTGMAEGSINAAASEYDDDLEVAENVAV
ncbi:MAG: ferritin-like protein [Cypionkella sp.]|uniref:YciE/YciF ferroxidase family protein n=1 Tax=Cypionkella sp. TaxID=2811411 RepID=UPI0026344DF2|nr:ferritin-like domain-containing protein [Cypionkella sp.]MDB5658063.1 ferritin-like protein [Cypionkella sp.]